MARKIKGKPARLYLPLLLDYHACEPCSRIHRGRPDEPVNHGKPRKHPFARIAFSKSFGVAFQLPFVLVAWVMLAGGIGYLFDRWLRTAPWLMLALGFLGFAGGVWDVLRRLGGGAAKRERENGR